MLLIDSLLMPCYAPFHATYAATCSGKDNSILNRIKNCFISACKWFYDQRYFMLSTSMTASGLALGVVALTADALALLPIAFTATAYGLLFFVHTKQERNFAFMDLKRKEELKHTLKKNYAEIRSIEKDIDVAEQNVRNARGNPAQEIELQQQLEKLRQLREQLRKLRTGWEFHARANNIYVN